jgi:hypothetical protein
VRVVVVVVPVMLLVVLVVQVAVVLAVEPARRLLVPPISAVAAAQAGAAFPLVFATECPVVRASSSSVTRPRRRHGLLRPRRQRNGDERHCSF